MGAAAGVVAMGAGALGGWATLRLVMDLPYQVEVWSALSVVLGGMFATLAAGVAFAWGPLSARPAAVLRAAE
jgi:putative ABC transport system permease protein